MTKLTLIFVSVPCVLPSIMPRMKKRTNRGRNPGTGRKRKASSPLEDGNVTDSSSQHSLRFEDEEAVTPNVVPRSYGKKLAALRAAISSQSTTGEPDVPPKEFLRIRIVRALRRGMSVTFVAKTFGRSPAYVRKLRSDVILGGRAALSQKKRPGPPHSRRFKVALEEFRARIQENPRQTVRQLSRVLGITHWMGLRILKALGLRSRARRRRPFLTTAGKERRFNRARILLTKLEAKRPQALLFASDEAYFDIDPYRNSRTDRIIARTAEEGAAADGGIHYRRQRAPGLMVWGLVSSDGRSQLIVADHGVKVNTDAYLAVIGEHIDWLQEEYGDEQGRERLQGALWIQDSAPAHASGRTQAFLKEKLGNFGINLITKDMWPPSSPEINPLDFGVWGLLKHAVKVMLVFCYMLA